jgi:surface antigen
MKTVLRIAVCIFALSLSASQFGFSQSNTGVEQDLRKDEICQTHRNSNSTPSGDYIVAQLSGLTNYYRQTALNCMLPRQSFAIPIEIQTDIVGSDSTQRFRRQMICVLEKHLPVDQLPQAIVTHISGLEGYERYKAIECLKLKVKEDLTVDELSLILGPLRPEMNDAWDESLETFRPSDHRNALCALSPKLVSNISAQDANALLSLARDYQRYQALKCIDKKLAPQLSWDDILLVVGPSVSSIGLIIDLIHDKSPDGRNEQALADYQKSFSSRRFLVDPDPPNWLRGQCVEWTKLNFEKISDQNVRVPFVAARNIPERAEALGFSVEKDPKRARVGSMIVWDDGGAGHVGIVVSLSRDPRTGETTKIEVSESNWGQASAAGARRWGLDLQTAKDEFVTDQYGHFSKSRFSTLDLDRAPPGLKSPKSFKFAGYVHP